jgi:hypothetical protein
MGRNKNNTVQTQRKAKFYKAFEDVMKHYETMKWSSAISIIDTSDGAKSTGNPAQPTKTDFICDVDMQITKVIKNPKLLNDFFETFIMGDELLSLGQKSELEYKIGELFLRNGIWPVAKYFTTMRKRIRPE